MSVLYLNVKLRAAHLHRVRLPCFADIQVLLCYNSSSDCRNWKYLGDNVPYDAIQTKPQGRSK